MANKRVNKKAAAKKAVENKPITTVAEEVKAETPVVEVAPAVEVKPEATSVAKPKEKLLQRLLRKLNRQPRLPKLPKLPSRKQQRKLPIKQRTSSLSRAMARTILWRKSRKPARQLTRTALASTLSLLMFTSRLKTAISVLTM